MQEKFEKLFYEFVPQESNGAHWCHSPLAYFRGEKDLLGATMNVGFQVLTARVQLERAPHFHREDEYLVFFGAKLPDVFSSFDAEVHLYMGPTLDAMEKVVITEPTIIKLPKGWWHGPLNMVRIDKPLLFQAVMLAGKSGFIEFVERKDGERQYIYSGDETGQTENCLSHQDEVQERPFTNVPWIVTNEDGITSYTDAGAYDALKAPLSPECVIMPGYASKPYSDATALKAQKPALSPAVAKCVLAMPKEETKWGSWCPSPQAYFRGETYMEDATYHVGYQIFTAPNDMEDSHIHQGAEEYIFFMGADPMNIFDFDCEIEMWFGDDPAHMEKKLITKPTVVRIPANVWHCPILFRKMNKPVLFQAAFLSGTWGTITQVPEEKEPQIPPEVLEKMPFARMRTYNYMGDNVRFCKYNVQKRCNICGACFPSPDDYLQE